MAIRLSPSKLLKRSSPDSIRALALSGKSGVDTRILQDQFRLSSIQEAARLKDQIRAEERRLIKKGGTRYKDFIKNNRSRQQRISGSISVKRVSLESQGAFQTQQRQIAEAKRVLAEVGIDIANRAAIIRNATRQSQLQQRSISEVLPGVIEKSPEFKIFSKGDRDNIRFAKDSNQAIVEIKKLQKSRDVAQRQKLGAFLNQTVKAPETNRELRQLNTVLQQELKRRETRSPTQKKDTAVAKLVGEGKKLVSAIKSGDKKGLVPFTKANRKFVLDFTKGFISVFTDPVKGAYNYGRNLVNRGLWIKGKSNPLLKDVRRVIVGGTVNTARAAKFALENPNEARLLVGAAAAIAGTSLISSFNKNPGETLGQAVAILFPGTVVKGVAATGKAGIQVVKATNAAAKSFNSKLLKASAATLKKKGKEKDLLISALVATSKLPKELLPAYRKFLQTVSVKELRATVKSVKKQKAREAKINNKERKAKEKLDKLAKKTKQKAKKTKFKVGKPARRQRKGQLTFRASKKAQIQTPKQKLRQENIQVTDETDKLLSKAKTLKKGDVIKFKVGDLSEQITKNKKLLKRNNSALKKKLLSVKEHRLLRARLLNNVARLNTLKALAKNKNIRTRLLTLSQTQVTGVLTTVAQLKVPKQTIAQATKIIQTQTQLPKRIQKQLQVPKQAPKLRGVGAKTPPKKPVRIRIPRFKNLPTDKTNRNGYVIRIKEGNRIVSQTVDLLPFKRAKNLQRQILDRSLRASGEIVKVGVTKIVDVKNLVKGQKFRAKKSTNPKVRREVEKRKFRLDTKGEKSEAKRKSRAKRSKAKSKATKKKK